MSLPPRLAEAVRRFERGDLAGAEAAARALAKRDPRDVNAWQLLGLVMNRRGWFDRAVPFFEKCVTLRPDDAMSHCRLASARMYQGRFAEARRAFDRALAVQPAHPAAVRGKAELLEREGDAAGALALLEPVARARPGDAELAHTWATLLVRNRRSDEAITVAEQALAAPSIQPGTRRKLLFAVGLAHDRAKRYDEAFSAWRIANGTAGRPFDPAAHAARIDRVIEFFSPEHVAALPRSEETSERPVLVVGMPRSGSTLVEQILDAHPQVAGLGETTAFGDMIASTKDAIGTGKPSPDWIDDLPRTGLARLGRPYLEALARLAGRRADRIVDKNLLNFLQLGLVSVLFPRASVIHAVRDPLDNAISCYVNDLSPVGFPWTGDLGHIGAFLRDERRLMAHWRRTLDLRIIEVSYEALVNDQERLSRAVIEFCGLPWDDRCLRFHETGRAVTTLSYDQVRQPIYRTSVRRWECYARHLEPLRTALGDLADTGEAQG